MKTRDSCTYIYIYIHTHNHIYVYIYIFNECVYIYIYLYHIMLGFQALKKHNWLCSWYSLFVETPQRVRGSRRVLALPRPSADCDWVYPKSWRFFWWKVPQTKWMSWRYPMTWETLQYIIYILCIWIGVDRQPPKYMVWSQKGDETTTPLLTTRVSCFNLCECEPNI